MKKIIVAILSILVGSVGYTIVDKTIENRVSELESKVSYLEEVVEFYHSDYSITNETLSSGLTKSEFVDFFNAETAKAAKGSYKFNRNCSYTDPIDVGNATDTLNSIISSIDKNSNLDTVVDGFLGIGTKTGTFPQDSLDENYRLISTSLKLSDVEKLSYSDGVYTFTLSNATNPKKTGATPLSRFTNDFITHEEVVDGIAGFTTLIKVNETNVNYTNTKVEVKVADGKIESIKYSYNFDATLQLKAIVTINGTCSTKTIASYTDLKY